MVEVIFNIFHGFQFDNMVSNAVTRATALDGTGNTSHETRFLREFLKKYCSLSYLKVLPAGPIDDSIAISKEPLIEGVLFRARYLGSTQLSSCDGQPTKSTRMMQAEKAVSRIKVRTNSVVSSVKFHECNCFVCSQTCFIRLW